MGLLLDRGAELEEFLGNGLLGGSEDVDEAVFQRVSESCVGE